MDPRYLAARLGPNDQPPSSCLTGMAESGRVDESSIFEDVDERSNFTFDFMRKFETGTWTARGVYGPLATTGEITDGEGDKEIVVPMEGTCDLAGDK